ncbi:dienelactone hydrolase [Thamnidium elegans]|uniref:Dienelactone hydrolase domain-containing protein n=1 Tax=Thamnidium elegans TaxID=101142 RepID=A0A8H7W1I6_9FUNG|nr:hypothetical protein INT48_008982 [Thamnidium elegans]KAI8091863.1 dienelactone hydrolase [Thamnidium elegans]
MSLPFKTYTFDPETDKKLPGAAIIVFQEWWGVTDIIKKHAQRIANNTGARTVVPDVYKGKIGLTAEEASHLMSNLDWDVAIGEMELLVTQLREQNYTSIGAIGFCMGGGLSLALASHANKIGKPIQVAIPCYGTAPASFEITNLKDTAVQGHFGGKDNVTGFSDPPAADKLEEEIKNAKDPIVWRYPEQGHAFLNDDDWSVVMRKELNFVEKDIEPISAEQAVRDQAWERIFSYLTKHLTK